MRGGDSRLQELRRLAKQGDPQARAKLELELDRSGQRKWLPAKWCSLSWPGCLGSGHVCYVYLNNGRVGVVLYSCPRCTRIKNGKTITVTGRPVEITPLESFRVSLEIPAGHVHYWYGLSNEQRRRQDHQAL